jgi:hypothetical protein
VRKRLRRAITAAESMVVDDEQDAAADAEAGGDPAAAAAMDEEGGAPVPHGAASLPPYPDGAERRYPNVNDDGRPYRMYRADSGRLCVRFQRAVPHDEADAVAALAALSLQQRVQRDADFEEAAWPSGPRYPPPSLEERVGRWVRIVGLTTRAELNGAVVRLGAWHEERERWQVAHAAQTLLLRTQNVHALSDDELEAIAAEATEAAAEALAEAAGAVVETLEAAVVASLAQETAAEAAHADATRLEQSEVAEAAEARFEAAERALNSYIGGLPISPAGYFNSRESLLECVARIEHRCRFREDCSRVCAVPCAGGTSSASRRPTNRRRASTCASRASARRVATRRAPSAVWAYQTFARAGACRTTSPRVPRSRSVRSCTSSSGSTRARAARGLRPASSASARAAPRRCSRRAARWRSCPLPRFVTPSGASEQRRRVTLTARTRSRSDRRRSSARRTGSATSTGAAAFCSTCFLGTGRCLSTRESVRACCATRDRRRAEGCPHTKARVHV